MQLRLTEDLKAFDLLEAGSLPHAFQRVVDSGDLLEEERDVVLLDSLVAEEEARSVGEDGVCELDPVCLELSHLEAISAALAIGHQPLIALEESAFRYGDFAAEKFMVVRIAPQEPH